MIYVHIGVGVSPETARKAVENGADLLTVGNYIFSNPNINQAIINLKNR